MNVATSWNRAWLTTAKSNRSAVRRVLLMAWWHLAHERCGGDPRLPCAICSSVRAANAADVDVEWSKSMVFAMRDRIKRSHRADRRHHVDTIATDVQRCADQADWAGAYRQLRRLVPRPPVPLPGIQDED
eukprot:11352893-Alexandrium_andersonii.AAC.1